MYIDAVGLKQRQRHELNKRGADAAPIVQRGPVKQRQNCGAINLSLQRLPLRAKAAHPAVCGGDRKRNEDEKCEPACPNVEFRNLTT